MRRPIYWRETNVWADSELAETSLKQLRWILMFLVETQCVGWDHSEIFNFLFNVQSLLSLLSQLSLQLLCTTGSSSLRIVVCCLRSCRFSSSGFSSLSTTEVCRPCTFGHSWFWSSSHRDVVRHVLWFCPGRQIWLIVIRLTEECWILWMTGWL